MDLSYLYEFCNSENQVDIIKGIEKHGNPTAAAAAAGKNDGAYRRRFREIKARAAAKGVAPESDMTKQAPEGFNVKGVSTYYNKDGEKTGQWVKTSIDQQRQQELIEEMIAAAREEIPSVKPTTPPNNTKPELANLFVISDFHLGALAWGEETGADWNMEIAEDLLLRWFRKAIDQAPNAGTAYFLDLGDSEHFENIVPVTSKSGHVLDASGRFRQVVRVMIRSLRAIIKMLLETHDRVVVIKTEGNHNETTAIQASEWLVPMYEDEPRVEIDNTPRPYYCHTFGSNMLCATHGHLKKFNELPLLFAAMFPEQWGQTKYRYCETGHLHHHHEKEHSGMVVTQHQTLASPDSYAARGGWISDRSAIVKTFHKHKGLCNYNRITPDMV